MKVLLLAFLFPLAFGHDVVERKLALANTWMADPMSNTAIDPVTAAILVRARHGRGDNIFRFTVWSNDLGPEVTDGFAAERACPSVNPEGTTKLGEAGDLPPILEWITTIDGPDYPSATSDEFFTSTWDFKVNHLIATSGVTDNVAKRDGENLNINFCIRFEMDYDTPYQLISFEEVAIFMKMNMETTVVTTFGARATDPLEEDDPVYEGATATAGLCVGVTNPVHQGDAVCLQICLNKHPLVHVEDIYSLIYEADGFTDPYLALVNGGEVGLTEKADPFCQIVGTVPYTGQQHCCEIVTVLPGIWFPPYDGEPRTVTATGSIRVLPGTGRRRLRVPFRMLEEAAVREFETQLELAPVEEESGAFRSITPLGLVAAFAGALLI